MKKILLLSLVILCAILALASCKAHEHSYSYTNTLSVADCVSEGWERDYCSCNQVIAERLIPATGHNFVGGEEVETEPTCTTVGYYSHPTCSTCGVYGDRTEIPMISHDWEAPCSHYCTSCYQYYEDVTREEHNFEYPCSNYCVICSRYYYDAEVAEHTYNNEYDDDCNVCGDYRYLSNDCPHENINVTKEAVAPTCETEGSTFTGQCKDCKIYFYSESIDALGHEWDDGTITSAPTCLKNGEKFFTCTRGCTKTESIEAPGHNFDTEGEGFCTVCSTHISSTELLYTSNGDGTCSVSGGSCERTYIVIPEKSPKGERVTAIKASAFKDFEQLLNITIPEGVTTINDYAFQGCYNLDNITLPASLTSISTRAFYRFSPDFFEVSEYSTTYTAINGHLCSYDGKTLIKACHNVNGIGNNYINVPDGVTTIADYALNYMGSAYITLASSVTTIGNYAFAETHTIRQLTFGSAEITSWGSYVFNGVKIITAYVNDLKQWLDIPAEVGIYCDKLSVNGNASTYEIPAGTTGIRRSAFSSNEYVRNVTFADESCISIGNYAFNNCTELRSIVITSSIVVIGDSAFAGCTALTDVYYTGSEQEWAMIYMESNNDCLKNATIHFNYVPEA